MSHNTSTKSISLNSYGIKNAVVNYNLSPEKLHQICIDKNLGTEVDSGALAVNTGEFTGRSPKDRFIVKDEISADKVWWSDINLPFDEDNFDVYFWIFH